MSPDGEAPGRDPLEELAEEFVERYRAGKSPSVEAYARDHPDMAESIRALFPALLDLERLADPKATDAPHELADFLILREIGRGGMGVVYLAEQRPLGRTVALKVLPAHLTLQEESVVRFRREATAMARLRHPGIARIFTVGEEAGTHFFAMEFVEGAPLDRVLSFLRDASVESLEGRSLATAVRATAHRPLGSEESGGDLDESSPWKGSWIEAVCTAVSQVADALEHAHGAGIVHRDVKPSNILLREDGTAVLTDFGLAREGGLPAITRTGQLAGTPYYMSPEQARASRARVDARTDVYSLGVTLYELLTLHRPFEGETSEEVLQRILDAEPTPPRKWRSLPRDLVTIVLKAMEKEPELRYPRAAAFAADLRAFLAYEPISARPTSLARRTRKLAQRHPVAAGAVLSLLVAGIGASIWWLLQPGYLTVTSPTGGATVYVDGTPRGTTPLERLEVSPGVHRVRLELGSDRFTPEEEVTVSRGREKPLDRELVSRNGVVKLESDPPDARVVLIASDGSEILVPRPTPALFEVPSGSYRARFQLAGFPPVERSIRIHPAGVRTDCSVTWPTGDLVFDGYQEGVQIEVVLGATARSDAEFIPITLPESSPLRLPADTYSLRARLLDHDRRDYEGASVPKIVAGGMVRAGVWLSPIVKRFDVRVGGVAVLDAADLDGDGLPEVLVGTWEGEGSHHAAEIRRIHRIPSFALFINRFPAARATEPHFHSGGRVLALGRDGARGLEIDAGAPVTAFAAVAGERETRIFVGTLAENILTFSHDGVRLQEVVLESGLEFPNVVAFLAPTGSFEEGEPGLVAAGWNGRIDGLGWDGTLRYTRAEWIEGYWTLVVADLEADGRPETLVSTLIDPQVSIFDDQGRHLRDVQMPELVTSLMAIDLDADGRMEVLAGTIAGRILALEGLGSATFDARVEGAVSHLAARDLDGDGTVEIVAATDSGRIVALDTAGDVVFEAQVPGDALALLLEDLEGDGRVEILVGTDPGAIVALDADGSLRFELSVDEPVSSILAPDLDGDGIRDPVAATRSRVLAWNLASVESFRARAVGSFEVVKVVDLDGDGRSTLVAGTGAGRIVSIEAHGAARTIDVQRPVRALAVAQLDEDPTREIVAGTVDGGILALRGDSILWHTTLDLGDELFLLSVSCIAAPDLDGDGRSEIVAGTTGGWFQVLDSSGSPLGEVVSWHTEQQELQNAIVELLAVDLDRDGRDEFVSATARGDVLFHANDATIRARASAPGGIRALMAADLDGDGRSEIVTADDAGWIHTWNADGTVRSRTQPARGAPVIAVADVDRDGSLEILVGTPEGRIHWIGADNDPHVWREMGQPVTSLLVHDAGGDGRAEVVAGTRSGEIHVISPEALLLSRHRLPFAVVEIFTGDLDGDGADEIVWHDAEGWLGALSAREDPRAGRRAHFLAALAAAEAGDEPSAEEGFRRAGLGWIPFDDTRLGSLRTRMELCSSSPSARRMVRMLDRVRAYTPLERLDGTMEFVRRGRLQSALALAREHLEQVGADRLLAARLNEAAWSFVDPRNPNPDGFELGLVLARAAVAASDRRDPNVLGTLAEALHANGRTTEAITVDEEALGKCPPADLILRPAIEAALERFRSEN